MKNARKAVLQDLPKEVDSVTNNFTFGDIQLLFANGGQQHVEKIVERFFAFTSLLHQDSRRVGDVLGGFFVEELNVKVVDDSLR